MNRITRSCKSRSASGFQIEERSSALPGSSTTWLDAEGRSRRSVQASPFGEIEMELTTKERALAGASTGAELPAESYERSLVHSNIRLPYERQIERLRVRITHKNPALGWPEFSDDRQTVISKSKDEIVLEVRRDPKAPQSSPAAEFSAPNALFQSDDRAVASIANEVAPLGKEIFALRDWTSRNMRFDPGIAVAPASEVVRNRAGTCFGYSVLLGSLARAAGMPSRMKMGFVYTGGIWGGHAWVEAYRDGEWVAVDAAMTSPKQADAARISFFSSSLEEGTVAGLGDLARMYGNVKIEVLEYTVNGKTTPVPKDAEAFRVHGDAYENPWLGLKLLKPSAFAFSRLEAVWPDTTIVELAGPNQERVSIHQISVHPDQYLARNAIVGARRPMKHRGAPAFTISAREKAVLVIPGEGNSWVVTAAGPLAGKVLKKAASGLSIERKPK